MQTTVAKVGWLCELCTLYQVVLTIEIFNIEQ